MIGKLSGKVDSVFTDYLIIDVGGVGYKVSCSGKTLAKLEASQIVSLLIETHVREDNIQLFGFINTAEKQMFLLLTTVKGIGTKVALGILSNFSPEQVSQAIAANDKTAYKALPGVGLKTWERVIIELKDKVVGTVYSQNGTTNTKINADNDKNAGLTNDAISALTNLGIQKHEAYRVVQELVSNEPEVSLSNLIRQALKKFAR